MSDNECVEFVDLTTYDPWVVPHQVLPAIATIMGMDWRDVFLVMYTWETIEVVLFNCFGVPGKELAANSLIADPVQCLMGVIVGKTILATMNNYKPLITEDYAIYRYMWSALFAIPSITLILDKHYAWSYIPVFLACMWLVRGRFYETRRLLPTYIILYVISTTTAVFSLEGVFNSFYAAISAAVVTIIIPIVFINVC
jgi:hypothetical protein